MRSAIITLLSSGSSIDSGSGGAAPSRRTPGGFFAEFPLKAAFPCPQKLLDIVRGDMGV
jgi:hypothetical protein